MKKLHALFAVFLIPILLLSACAPARPNCESEEVFCVGLVTDIGKINDRSFNQSAWKGVQQAQQELGALVQYIETADIRDSYKNISTFADENYDVIVYWKKYKKFKFSHHAHFFLPSENISVRK